MMRLIIEDAVREKFEMARIAPPLSVRFSRAGDEVILIGDRKKKLTGKELVLTDSAKIVCVYVHGDVDETKVTDATRMYF